MIVVSSMTPETTFHWGRELGCRLRPGSVIGLTGDLGAGKTCMVQGMAAGLDVTAPVTSPTFTILQIYHGKYPLYHFDLYRLDDAGSLEDFGIDEYLYGSGVTVIEWADKFPDMLPPKRLMVEITVTPGNGRRIVFRPSGQYYQQLIEEMISHCGC